MELFFKIKCWFKRTGIPEAEFDELFLVPERFYNSFIKKMIY
jgi:hypothetical protein